MKTLILFVAFILNFSSCHKKSSDKEKNSIAEPDKYSLQNLDYNHKRITLTDTPQITQLPFGPKVKKTEELCHSEYSFYMNLIGVGLISDTPKYNLRYRMPEIHLQKYLVLDSTYQSKYCDDKLPVDSHISINYYNYKLPNQKKDVDVYYSCGSSYLDNNKSEKFAGLCPDFIYDYYGYLIFYNKPKKDALIIPVFYSTIRDASSINRVFLINPDYNISICHYEMVSGENGIDKSFGPGYEITFNSENTPVVRKTYDSR